MPKFKEHWQTRQFWIYSGVGVGSILKTSDFDSFFRLSSVKTTSPAAMQPWLSLMNREYYIIWCDLSVLIEIIRALNLKILSTSTPLERETKLQ